MEFPGGAFAFVGAVKNSQARVISLDATPSFVHLTRGRRACFPRNFLYFMVTLLKDVWLLGESIGFLATLCLYGELRNRPSLRNCRPIAAFGLATASGVVSCFFNPFLKAPSSAPSGYRRQLKPSGFEAFLDLVS